MAFSCSYILSKVRKEADNCQSDAEKTQNLKRPCPFSDEKVGSDILPEAVDVLDSIFTSLCSVSQDSVQNIIELRDKECTFDKDRANQYNFACESENSRKEKVETNSTKNEVIQAASDFSEEDNLNVSVGLVVNEVINQNSVSSMENCIDEIDLTVDESSSNSIKAETSKDVEQSFDFSCTPVQVTGSWKEFVANKGNNYTRGCKWAPDGSCILTCSEDNVLRLFNLPEELWDSSKWVDMFEMEAVLKISEGEQVYDYCWYPLMNSLDPNTCCLISTSRNSPVHMWDAFTGELRCSYRSYDHVDEVTAALSISFDSSGDKIFCGFDKTIRVFDVNLPGRHFEERKTFAKKSGQSGIISCFAFTSANRNISAAGSYRRRIGIYSEPDGDLQCLVEGQKGGVTQLLFSPDGQLLFSGGRKDPEILCWDVRNMGDVLFCLRRCNKTNQRMYFDVSRCGQFVVSGNHNGVISVWDVHKEPKELPDGFSVLEPVQFFMAHGDCVNGISMHPSFPLLCSSSGQRRFPALLDGDEEDEMFASRIDPADNSLRLWWVGK